MSKLRSFNVTNGRTLFKCPACKKNRMFTIPPGVRLRTLRCFNCGESTRCTFNRRATPREQQSGRVMLFCEDGRIIEVDLFDISDDGVGFEVPSRDISRLSVGRYVSLKCPWSPHLFSQGRYVIRSINGQRVGAQRTK